MAKLKPQDFTGIAGKDVAISAIPELVIAQIRKRKDLPISLANYLIQLVKYVSSSSVSKSDLAKAFKKVQPSDKSAIQKDFSEILGPIILANNKDRLSKLGLSISSQSKMFIPSAGNYPLVDFMIRTGKNEDQYSVKTLQKTTNTMKAGDVLSTVSDAVKKKYRKETEILNLIHNNDAKLGPILILSMLAPEISEFKKTHRMYKKFISIPKITNDILEENAEDWYSFFEPIVDNYYTNGKKTFNKAWKRGYYYDALTVLAQYTVADYTKDMNWMPFVDDVQSKVSYFKFGLNSNGTYEFDIINGKSERKPNQSFRLRAKSRLKEGAESSRSGQDKLGIQP